MQNEVWSEIGIFLNTLRCENIRRKSYVQFPEMEDAEEQQKKAKKNFETVKRNLSDTQKELVENYIETLQHRAFISEEQAYCQGYVDCIQLLAGLGLLLKNPEIERLACEIKK